MKQNTKNPSGLTVCLDVGDRHSVAIVLDAQGEVIEELKIPSTKAGIHSTFDGRSTCRVALEAGTHSPWMSEMITACGTEVFVANLRKVHLIGRSLKKTGRVDAENLPRLACMDPKFLLPIQHQKNASRQHLVVLRSRDAAVAMRTKLVNHVRHQVKVWGERLRCNGWVRESETVNQIAAPDRTDLSMHRSQWWITKSANGSPAADRSFSLQSLHDGLDRSKLLMEAFADRPSPTMREKASERPAG